MTIRKIYLPIWAVFIGFLALSAGSLNLGDSFGEKIELKNFSDKLSPTNSSLLSLRQQLRECYRDWEDKKGKQKAKIDVITRLYSCKFWVDATGGICSLKIGLNIASTQLNFVTSDTQNQYFPSTLWPRWYEGYPSSVTLREGNTQNPYQSINTSYPIRKSWWLYLLLEKSLAIASYTKALERRNDKCFRRVTKESYADSWSFVTDLEPHQADARWYALRSGVECLFKDTKRGGFGWHHTKITDPKRAERHSLLSIALATFYDGGLYGGRQMKDPRTATTPLPLEDYLFSYLYILRRYWTDFCAEISSRLLLPVVTDSRDLDSSLCSIATATTVRTSHSSGINIWPCDICSNRLGDCYTWSSKTVATSWFSTKLYIAQTQSLGFRLDKLISKISKAKCRQKKRMRLAANRIRGIIRNLVDELHKKTARFLVDTFDVIRLPTFETSQMSLKAKRRIMSKSVRQMLTLSHYKFKQFLKHKAFEMGKVAMDVNEAYTSKTVSWTGEIVSKLGGAKFITSKLTGQTMPRDWNGARGIFLAFGNASRTCIS